ncbi:MAG: hypothetical protein AAFU57_03670 [Bacteroidota bacterium]
MNETLHNLRGYLNRIQIEDLKSLEKIYWQKQKIQKTFKYWILSTAVFALLVSLESDYALLDIQEVNFLDWLIQYLLLVFLPVTFVLGCLLYLISLRFKGKLTTLCLADKTPFKLLKKELETYFQEKQSGNNSVVVKE